MKVYTNCDSDTHKLVTIRKENILTIIKARIIAGFHKEVYYFPFIVYNDPLEEHQQS
jgi:hypothetical protein